MKVLDRIGILFGLVGLVAFIGHFTHSVDFSIGIIFLSLGALLRSYFGPKYTEKDIFEMNLKYAKKHLNNPVHVHVYMKKHQLTYKEIKALINLGEISAYGGIEEVSVFIDEI